MPLYDTDDLLKIEFSHAQAVEMALANIAWQADDTFFDALLEIWIDDSLFFKQGTTDAFGLWWDLLNAIEKPGKHHITFLDYDRDLTIKHGQNYEFFYIEKEYEWDENDVLVRMTKTTISSALLPKEEVEEAIKEAFMLYADFILQNDLPISAEYKRHIAERKNELGG